MLWLQSSFHPSLPNRAQPLTSWVGPKKLPNFFFAKLFGPNPKSVKPNSNKNNETRNQTRDAIIKSKPFLVFDWFHHHAWDPFGLLVLSPCGALKLKEEMPSSNQNCLAFFSDPITMPGILGFNSPHGSHTSDPRVRVVAESLVGVTSSSR